MLKDLSAKRSVPKKLHMLTNCQRDLAPDKNRINFAIKYLEYNKLKASTRSLHVTKRAAKFHFVLAKRFHLVVNEVIFTVKGIYIANNLLLL